VPDKLTSPAGEEFVLADASVNRVLVKGVVAVMHARTERLWSTKEGDMFLCADAEGNLDAEQATGAGFYWRDTRYLSDFRLEVDGHAPLLLSTSADRAFASHVDLANQDLLEEDGTVAHVQGTINIRRTRVIDGRLYERIRIKNYNSDLGQPHRQADLRHRLRRHLRGPRAQAGQPGQAGPPQGRPALGRVRLRRRGRGLPRDPDRLRARADRGQRGRRAGGGHLGPAAGADPDRDDRPDGRAAGRGAAAPERSFDAVMHDLRRSYEAWERSSTRVWTDNELYNSLLSRGLRDLRALLTPTRYGSVVAAGIPWFVAPFGRDSLLTCHQTLMVNPDLTRTTLEVLAAFQADEVDDWRDAQPGKILHELRQGELAGAGIIPHTPYYGSIDSTPLWLLLLGTYYRWTGDLEFCRRLLPNVERALAWIADYGDLDGDGFLEYQRSSPRGLVNQGWKDSHDSVTHVDGKLAEGPIALAEVQAYVYLAKLRMAEVFEALGNRPGRPALREAAAGLRHAFNEAFWVESEQFYAMALDGEKRQVAPSPPTRPTACTAASSTPTRPGPWPGGCSAPDMFSGLGGADPVQVGRRLQPDELPQRLHLAPRQRHHRGRAEALRVRQGDQPAGHGDVRDGRDGRRHAPARAVLRLHPALAQPARSPTRSPARPRRGPPAPRSCSSRRCWGSRRTRPPTPSTSTSRTCPAGSTPSSCTTSGWGSRRCRSCSSARARRPGSRCWTRTATSGC
jgi:hypothetical protein